MSSDKTKLYLVPVRECVEISNLRNLLKNQQIKNLLCELDSNTSINPLADEALKNELNTSLLYIL